MSLKPRCGERHPERMVTDTAHAVHRYLGLCLGGAKSDRTCLAVLDYYPKQKKSFAVDVYEAIASEDGLTSDQVLIDLIFELSEEVSQGREDASIRVMGVDAPLTLPPCLQGCDSDCQGYEKCRRPEVRWMKQQYQRAKAKNSKLKHFTPYSQRPVDLYFRYKYLDQNPFQDETMGANLAPQAVRMTYLKRYLTDLTLIEVWPKLALFHMQKALRVTKRDVLEYRHIERGVQVRERLLDQLAEKSSVFIYERDRKKIVSNVGTFDAMLCAWVAMQYDLDQVVKFKSDLPLESGWVQIPEL